MNGRGQDWIEWQAELGDERDEPADDHGPDDDQAYDDYRERLIDTMEEVPF